MANMNSMQRLSAIIAIIVIALIAFYLFFTPFVIINPGEVGVVFNKFSGLDERVLEEGFHFLIPGIQTVTEYSVKERTYTFSSKVDEGAKKGKDSVNAKSSDGQPVEFSISMIYKLNKNEVFEFHRIFEDDRQKFEEIILRPIMKNIAELVISRHETTELYSSNPTDFGKDENTKKIVGREKILNELEIEMKKAFEKKYIEVINITFNDIEFSEEFQKYIDAEQKKKTALKIQQVITTEAQTEANKILIVAEAEAKAIEKVGQLLSRYPEYIQYIYVQKLAPNVKAIISDQKNILSLGGFLEE